ncbi:DUF763 domain-containing protein [Candidatus Micrarchaeota archaeon]|nr:DUF763 domain-containing protein [Candidatus Micrarchaeota archaeon]
MHGTGMVDLPLHGGHVPPWLFSKMRELSTSISKIIVNEYGTLEYLKRISDPMFFQALNCVIGMDWHSSGSTTTLTGALKVGLLDSGSDIGIAICGGKGRTSMKTPEEIDQKSDYFNLSGQKREELKVASFLSAKVDSSCIQAGYSLYHHCMFFDEDANWAVVQQGLNNQNNYARRYHWFNSENFVDNPNDKIAGIKQTSVLNLVSGDSSETREVCVDLVKDNPIHLRKYFTGQKTLFDEFPSTDNHYKLPARHEIIDSDLTPKDWQVLEQAYELQPQNYEELISLRGMGKKKLRALALIAKLVHGTNLDWKDPVKYSFAHGGKDGFPFPIEREAYDNSISFLKDVLNNLKNEEKKALQKLSTLTS